MRERLPPSRPRTLLDRLGALVDRAIFAVAPEVGARRMAVRRQWDMAADLAERFADPGHGFEGAEWDRLRGSKWASSRLSINSDLEYDLTHLRRRTRDISKNDSIGGAVDARVNHVVGAGFTPQPRVAPVEGVITEAQASLINRQLGDLYERIHHRLDLDGVRSLWQLTRLADRLLAVDGEAFVVFSDLARPDRPLPLILEVVDTDRVETPPDRAGDPRVRLGIEKDAQGRVVFYHVRKQTPNDIRTTDITFDRVPARRVCHLFEPWFAGQARGLPWMTRVLNRVRDAKDLDEATIVAAQVEACFAMFIKTTGAGRAAVGNGNGSAAAGGRREQDIHPGTVKYLNPGEEPVFANPSKPGSTYAPFQEWNYRRSAAGINWPYEMVAKNWAGTSFAGGRLVLTEAKIDAECRQRLLIELLLVPFWEALVDEAVLLGQADIRPALYRRAPWAFRKHYWMAPAWQYALNPGEEVGADVEAIDNNLTTLSDRLAARGRTLEDVIAVRRREVELLKEAGITPPPKAGAAPAVEQQAGADTNAR